MRLPGIDEYTAILSLLFYIFIIMYFFFGQNIQAQRMLISISSALNKIKSTRDWGRNALISFIKESGTKAHDINVDRMVDEMLEYFTVMPVDLDPFGIVKKIERVLNIRETRVRDEIERIFPPDSRMKVSITENLLGVVSALNFYYKIVRHYYLLGKRTSNYFLLAQLQVVMPMIMQEVEALYNAIDAIRNGYPLGDGVGCMVAGKFMVDHEKRYVAKDVVFTQLEYKNRKIFVVKAEGPYGNVRNLGNAIEFMITNYGINPALMITIDAALKYEGEKTGEIAEGVGVAIGGIGVDRYKIEEIAAKRNILLYAIVIKESLAEVISAMSKEVAEKVQQVVDRVYRVIEERTKEGESAVVIGVGNTLGVAQ